MSNNAIDFHSKIAQDFDKLYQSSKDFRERYTIWTKTLSRYVSPGESILDAGCGSGIFSFYLMENNENVKVVGIDGAQEMINICNRKKANLKLENIRFVEGSLPLTGFDNEMFDLVISSSVLEYVEQLSQTLVSLEKVLKKNGTLILSIPNSKSIYKQIEKLCFNIFGKPKYLNFVHNNLSLSNFNNLLEGLNLNHIEHQYYAANYPAGGVLKNTIGARRAANLIIAIYKKSGISATNNPRP